MPPHAPEMIVLDSKSDDKGISGSANGGKNLQYSIHSFGQDRADFLLQLLELNVPHSDDQ